MGGENILERAHCLLPGGDLGPILNFNFIFLRRDFLLRSLNTTLSWNKTKLVPNRNVFYDRKRRGGAAARISAARLTREERKTVSQAGVELGRAEPTPPACPAEEAAGGPRPPGTPRPTTARHPAGPWTCQCPPQWAAETTMTITRLKSKGRRHVHFPKCTHEPCGRGRNSFTAHLASGSSGGLWGAVRG